MNRFSTPPRYLHAEAFSLMLYESEDHSIKEWLWNSRDAVTPFCISSKDGKVELIHQRWSLDQRRPFHVPAVGDRIFINLTKARAVEYRTALVEKFWSSGKYPLSDGYESKETAIEQLAAGDYESFGAGTSPDTVVVDEAMHAIFLARCLFFGFDVLPLPEAP